MEVDLVICFDANVSPLRMIQRMGRTGRKNKGRVVVLAYDGSELRGYMQKKAKGKTINKHLINGANSFHFHSSPRMVPHVFRPEKLLVKLFIEEFVHRGMRVKANDAIQTPKYKLRLTDVESDLLGKYFQPSREHNWRPSLIAFPHFQAFPSGVHEVAHSMRTTMLIDIMKCLQESSFSNHSNSFSVRDEDTLESFEIESIDHLKNNIREDDLIQNEPESDTLSFMDASRTEEKHAFLDTQSQNLSVHSFLFGSDYMSVDSHGNVLILSVPLFPSKQVSPSNSSISKASRERYQEISSNVNVVSRTPLRSQENEGLEISSVQNTDDLKMEKIAGDDRVFQMEICNLKVSNKELNTAEISSVVADDTRLGDDLSSDFKAGDLSPRLTNLVMSGVVPESPIDEGTSNKAEGDCMTRDLDMLPDASISLVQSKTYEEAKERTPNKRNFAALCVQGEIRTPGTNQPNSSSEKCISTSNFVREVRTPLKSLAVNSCSKDWILSSGENSISQPKQRLKRLRKLGDINRGNLLGKEGIVGHTSVSGRSGTGARLNHASEQHGKGDEKRFKDAQVFIEYEAEVSSDASDDEELDNGQDSYDGSFIDDRINPTVASTQAEAAECDMMAIYRRSLLSQSPITSMPNFSVDLSPGNMIPMDQSDGSNAAGTTNPSPYTSHTNTNGDSSSIRLNTERFSSDFVIPITTNENRKRKSCLSQGGSLPIRNLETEMCFHPEATNKEPLQEKEGESVDAFDTDDFYQGIDLDALEEQATKQLRSRSEASVQITEIPENQNLESLDYPSFNLGI